jgi:uncharacterized protein (DUF1697 family)
MRARCARSSCFAASTSARGTGLPRLREVLGGTGFGEVATYLQSGNVVLSSDASPAELAAECERLIAASFGLDIAAVVRTRDELAGVVERNPLGEVAANPKRYQVSFLNQAPSPELVQALAELAAPQERLIAIGRELYAWHPDGIGRSRLWARLAGPALGVKATARNWTTVTRLLALAGS